jgi:hypothetical protein
MLSSINIAQKIRKEPCITEMKKMRTKKEIGFTYDEE